MFTTKHNFFNGRPRHPFIITQSDNDGIKHVSLERIMDWGEDEEGRPRIVGNHWGPNQKRKEQRMNEPHKLSPEKAVHNIKGGFWVELEIGEDDKLYRKDTPTTPKD